jgi:amidase
MLRQAGLVLGWLCLVISPIVEAAPVPLDSVTIADLNAAFKAGTLSSEQLVQMYLKRIEAFDEQGPKINSVITLNPKALELARALDSERKSKGPRSPLHGIPVVLKDNFDTTDMPTTGASVLLEGSIPPDDAFLVKKLRDAGAIILAKVNLSEFASGGAHSSLGGQTLNPHDLTRSPAGSSGGTGAAVAALFSPLGYGTDTGGSIRGPSTANGIVGLKPTHGLLSRDGIIPLALTFDTGGPMTRSVYDIALSLNFTVGVDKADDATKKSAGKFEKDYTKFLKKDALKGARIGIARDFLGADEDVDWVIESALAAMRAAGATVVDVRYPKWLLDAKTEFYGVIRNPEFATQIGDYLATTDAKYPKNIDQLIERANDFRSIRPDGAGPNARRWNLMKKETATPGLDDQNYLVVREQGLALVRAALEGIIASNKLDAIVYPTSPRRPGQIAAPVSTTPELIPSATNFANLSGFPDLIVPAGFTSDDLPVGISFFGPAFSEPKLLALGYSFEQVTKAIRVPVNTPLLAGDVIEVP